MLFPSEREALAKIKAFTPEQRQRNRADYDRAYKELHFFRNGGLTFYRKYELLEGTILKTYYRILVAHAQHRLLCGEWTFEDCERLEREMCMADNQYTRDGSAYPEGRPFFEKLKAFAWDLGDEMETKP